MVLLQCYLCHMWVVFVCLFFFIYWHRRNGIPHNWARVIVQNGGGVGLGMSSTVVRIIWSVWREYRVWWRWWWKVRNWEYCWGKGKHNSKKDEKGKQKQQRKKDHIMWEDRKVKDLGRDCSVKWRERKVGFVNVSALGSESRCNLSDLDMGGVGVWEIWIMGRRWWSWCYKFSC